MKKMLLPLATVITTAAAGVSLYIVSLPKPTEAQTNLANTTNAIAITGTAAIFGLLDDDQDDPSTS